MVKDVFEEHSTDLLKELHILTRDGRLNQDSRRKLKQIRHLYRFLEGALTEIESNGLDLTVVDHGAGKSYLGFILYDLYFRDRQRGQIYGVEARADLVNHSRMLAERLGFSRMTFVNCSIADSHTVREIPERVALVTALHACDTATDDAISFALAKRAAYIALVPCCQAEVARALNFVKAQSLARTPLAELWRHPLHTREFGSQITNVLRCLHLEACGYEVTVTELVGWEHSLKNELIIARWSGRLRQSSRDRLQSILRELGLSELLSHRYLIA